MCLQRNSDSDKITKTVGYEQLITEMREEIRQYFVEDQFNSIPYLAVVKGEVGQGKTAFARHFLSELHTVPGISDLIKESNDSQNLTANEELPIFSSSVNSETQMHFMNAWRPIFQAMFFWYCSRNRSVKE